MTRSRSRFLVACAALLVTAPLALANSFQGSFERTYQVTGAVELEILTRSGDITVNSGPAGSVVVRGKIHVGHDWFSGNRQGDVSEIEKNPPIKQTGNSISIDYLSFHDISVDYEITAPPDTRVGSHSGSGDQRIEGLRGNLDLESGSGDMRLREISSQIHVHTGSGDIDARGIAGPFTAEAGSGDIRAEEKASADVSVHTGSGNIELRGVAGALRAESGSGDMTIDGVVKDNWEVRASSGNVQLTLPQQAGFDLDASTGSGSVVVDRPVTMTVQGDLRKAQRNVKGQVNGGGPQLTVHTGSGDINIH